jgi:hypothetical protein
MIKIIAGLCVGTVLSFSQAHAKTAQQAEAFGEFKDLPKVH